MMLLTWQGILGICGVITGPVIHATTPSPKDFEEAYRVVQPTLKSLKGVEAYGVGGVEVGEDLLPAQRCNKYRRNGCSHCTGWFGFAGCQTGRWIADAVWCHILIHPSIPITMPLISSISLCVWIG